MNWINKLKNYFIFDIPVDKKYILEYYIKTSDYTERLILKTDVTDYTELMYIGKDSLVRGFHQDNVIYSPHVILKILIKEKQ